MDIEKYEYKGCRNFKEFVKEHRNIFNDKTRYKEYVGYDREGHKWGIIAEYNYHDNNLNIWLWLTDYKHYWVIRGFNKMGTQDIFNSCKEAGINLTTIY